MSDKANKAAGPEELAAALFSNGALTAEWMPSFLAVPRHRFMPEVIWPGKTNMNHQADRVVRGAEPDLWRKAVYSDIAITTQWDDGKHVGPGKGRIASSSSSMPTMVFSMLDALDVQTGHQVLEIGTGTGWNAALLCHRLGDLNVTTVEVDERLAEDARARLFAAGFTPTIIRGDGAQGHGAGSPYDRIIATCSLGHVPSQWIGQGRPGTVIVAPWGPIYGGEGIVRLTIDEAGRASGPFISSSAFMRMRQQRRNLPPTTKYLDPEQWPADGMRTTTTLSPDDVGDWLPMFVIGVRVPDLFLRVDWGEQGAYRMWLFDTDVTSWATADYAKGLDEFTVVQAGPRNLWSELEAAWWWWDSEGRPGFERFGLSTVGGPFFEVWLDSPDNPISPSRLGELGRK